MAWKKISVCPDCGAPIYSERNLKSDAVPESHYSCECRHSERPRIVLPALPCEHCWCENDQPPGSYAFSNHDKCCKCGDRRMKSHLKPQQSTPTWYPGTITTPYITPYITPYTITTGGTNIGITGTIGSGGNIVGGTPIGSSGANPPTSTNLTTTGNVLVNTSSTSYAYPLAHASPPSITTHVTSPTVTMNVANASLNIQDFADKIGDLVVKNMRVRTRGGASREPVTIT